MKPRECVNCDVTFWQKNSELYCKKCQPVANEVGRSIDRKRRERAANEELDIELLVELGKWL